MLPVSRIASSKPSSPITPEIQTNFDRSVISASHSPVLSSLDHQPLAAHQRSASFTDLRIQKKSGLDALDLTKHWNDREKNFLKVEIEDLRKQLEDARGDSAKVKMLEELLDAKQRELYDVIGETVQYYEDRRNNAIAGSNARRDARNAERDEQVRAARNERDEALALQEEEHDENIILKQEISDLHKTRIQLEIKLEKSEKALKGREEYWDKVKEESLQTDGKFKSQADIIARMKRELDDTKRENAVYKLENQQHIKKNARLVEQNKREEADNRTRIKEIVDMYKEERERLEMISSLQEMQIQELKKLENDAPLNTFAVLDQLEASQRQVGDLTRKLTEVKNNNASLQTKVDLLGNVERENTQLGAQATKQTRNMMLFQTKYNDIKEQNNTLRDENMSLQLKLKALLEPSGAGTTTE